MSGSPRLSRFAHPIMESIAGSLWYTGDA